NTARYLGRYLKKPPIAASRLAHYNGGASLSFRYLDHKTVAKVCYAQMVKQFLSRDPFECVLCGGRMVYRRAIAGLNVEGLKKNARDISLLRYMPA
ncbi:transposase, partial [Shigella sonnei]